MEMIIALECENFVENRVDSLIEQVLLESPVAQVAIESVIWSMSEWMAGSLSLASATFIQL